MTPAPRALSRCRFLAVAPLLGAAALAACSRDLSIPPLSTLTLTDPFPSAAPDEQLTISAAGGSRPYRFEFAPGGNGSEGTVDAATGAYRAGAMGPAIDLVDVIDASGAKVEARITVGPPLQVSPTTAFVAPGGRASFVPTGGKPPYRLEVVGGPAPGTVAGTTFVAAPSGGCAGTVSSPASVALRLSDATSAPPVALTVTVGRGLDLFPAAGTGAVAPYEQIAFIASGGQPPYQFDLATAASAGCAVEPGRGTYVAGSTGNAVDVVRVTDAIGQERCFSVDVGPALAVTLASSDLRPGKPTRVLASGGRAPYTFSFAFKGNRSFGTIDAVTGEYVPGRNALATDLLVVSDATSAPPFGPIAVTVGPTEVVTGDGNWGCVAAQLNGDAFPDALLFAYFGDVKTVLTSAVDGLPEVKQYPVQLDAQPVALDLDGDGYTDVVYVTSTGLHTLLAQPGGALVSGPGAPLVPRGTPLAAGAGGLVLVAANDPQCPGAALVGYRYDRSTRAFRAPTCLAVTGTPTSLAAGDFDGDGADDYAYGVNDGGAGRGVLFRLSSDVPPYSVERAVPLPAPWLAVRFNLQEVNPWLALRPGGAPYADLVAVVTDARTGGVFGTGLAVLAGGPGGLTLKQVLPVTPGGYNIMSVSPIGFGPGGRPQLVAANVTNGTTLLLDYDRTSATPLTAAAAQLPPRAFRVGSVCSGDFDGDGTADLLVAPRGGLSAPAEILLGEGDGSYARRPRFVMTAYCAGDVDGDGVSDFVDVTPDGTALRVLFSSDGELALGPDSPVDGQFLSALVADWDGDGAADLLVRSGAASLWWYQGLPSRDGRFAVPVRVATTDAAGQPAEFAAAGITGARFLATPHPGLDAFAMERVGSIFRHVALLFRDATHATVAYPPTRSYFAPLAFDADGDGHDDLAEAAPFPALSLVRPSDPPGATWPFRPWVEVSQRQCAFGAGAVPVPGSSPARSRGVYVCDDGLLLVDAPGGVPAAVDIAIDPTLLASLTDAHLALVNGDAYPDLVVAKPVPLPWLVFPGTPDGRFAATPDAALSFSPGMGGGYMPAFLPVHHPGGQDDLVVNGYTTVVVLHNDGQGHFR